MNYCRWCTKYTSGKYCDEACREKRREYNKLWKANNTGYNKLWKANNKERVQLTDKACLERRHKIQLAVIGAYSNETNACVRCGFNDFRCLQLDHINGGGNQARKIRSNQRLYVDLYKNNFPDRDKYRVLCCNCNRIVHYERTGHWISDYPQKGVINGRSQRSTVSRKSG